MCFSTPDIPPPPKPTPAAERQQVKLPDNGSTANRADDIARRRRLMSATAFTGSLGLGSPTTTTVLGG